MRYEIVTTDHLPPSPARAFVGFDPREIHAQRVAERSLRALASVDVRPARVGRSTLRALYDRPTTLMPNGQLYDEISGAPMSTEHAIARFFVPLLCDYAGWALFVDGDVLVRADVADLFALRDDRYAVMCVQHPDLQVEDGSKKDGHVQQPYARKNWSSVMLFNCGHAANRALTPDILNAWPGRDLHRFRWLADAEVGPLPARWNHLVAVSPPTDDVAIAHFTLGLPDVAGHADDPFADEWRAVARACGYRFAGDETAIEEAL